MRNRGQLFWGVMLILAGIVFLLGIYFDFNVWQILWPLFIIIVGVWILLGALIRPEPMETEALNLPLEGATAADVLFKYGAGHLFVDGTAGPGDLLSGTFGGGIRHTERRAGERLEVVLRSPNEVWVWPWSWWSPHTRRWSVGLSPAVPLRLRLETGALEAHLDLSTLQVQDLKISTGASSTDVKLPAGAGYTRVKVEAGAASVNLEVPPGVAAQIRSEVGLASVDVDQSRFPRAGKVYRSPDYETAENRVEIFIEGGVGSMSVR
jgi:hypothetical protein